MIGTYLHNINVVSYLEKTQIWQKNLCTDFTTSKNYTKNT
jgi:hypothetical protein